MTFIDDRIKSYGIIVALVAQILLVGIAWGTLWTKVNNLERLVYVYVEQGNRHTQNNGFGPGQALATPLKTDRETNSERTTVSDSIIH